MWRLMLICAVAIASIASISDAHAQATDQTVEHLAIDELRQKLEELRRQHAEIQEQIAEIEERLFHASADEGEIPEGARIAAGDHKLYALGELARIGDLEVRLKSFDHKPREFSVTDHLRAQAPRVLGLPMYAATITVRNTSQGRVAKPFREATMFSGVPEVVAQDNWENKLVGQSLSSVHSKVEATTSSGFKLLGADVLPGETIDFLLPVESPKVFNVEWFIVRVKVHHGDESERIAFFVPAKAIANFGYELAVEDPSFSTGDADTSVERPDAGDADAGGASFFGIEAAGSRFAYLVDVSGSMGVAGKLDTLRAELNRSLGALKETSTFFVCAFNAAAHPLGGSVEWTDATDRGKVSARRSIATVRSGGATNPEPGLTQIFGLRPRPDAIYFMTDGQFDEAVVQIIERLNRKAKVPIHCITLGDSGTEAEATMRYIARRSGGRYKHVPSAGGGSR